MIPPHNPIRVVRRTQSLPTSDEQDGRAGQTSCCLPPSLLDFFIPARFIRKGQVAQLSTTRFSERKLRFFEEVRVRDTGVFTGLAERFAIRFGMKHSEMRFSSRSTCGTARKKPLNHGDVWRLISGNLRTVPKIPQAVQWFEGCRGMSRTCHRASSWKGLSITLANRCRSGAECL